jgi:NADH-quinone oxidoreductase subunit N
LASIAGIPPLVGFLSKLGILLCLLSKNHVMISLIVVTFSAVGCFYYIRVIKIMFFKNNQKSQF